LQEYGLSDDLDIPVIGMVTRLVDQKGVDLVAGALNALLELNCRLVILGSGESRYESLLTEQGRAHPDRIGVRIGFDETLSHQIEAGSDCFLMPSRYEPCGLNQIYSLRYGTIPIVRATGGLRDTVVPFDASSRQGTGFVFQDASPAALTEAVRAAVAAFANTDAWQQMMRTGMAQDFSWTRSATRYIDLYQQVVAARQGAAPSQ
jgi:starch synthase